MSIFYNPTFMNMAIINTIGIVIFFIITVLSAWITDKNKKNSNPVWLASIMSIVSLSLVGYNAYSAYGAYSVYSAYSFEENTSVLLVISYGLLTLFFFAMMLGALSTTKENNREYST